MAEDKISALHRSAAYRPPLRPSRQRRQVSGGGEARAPFVQDTRGRDSIGNPGRRSQSLF